MGHPAAPPIPDDVTTNVTSVDGVPAVYARYTVEVPAEEGHESPEAASMTNSISLLLLERDGVLVLLPSVGYPTTDAAGPEVQLEPLGEDELAALVESLEPVG